MITDWPNNILTFTLQIPGPYKPFFLGYAEGFGAMIFETKLAHGTWLMHTRVIHKKYKWGLGFIQYEHLFPLI